MKWQVSHYRNMMYVVAGCFVLVCLWSLRDVLRSNQMRAAVDARQADQHVLRLLQQQAHALDADAHAWSVDGSLSLEMREKITRASARVTFADPQVVGRFRLHKAEIVMGQESLDAFLARLGDVQGLLVRMVQMTFSVDDRNRATGSVELAWLERF
ncbi:MAG: hypothetical protein ACNA71_00590 [Kiritimatiellia bacterium]